MPSTPCHDAVVMPLLLAVLLPLQLAWGGLTGPDTVQLRNGELLDGQLQAISTNGMLAWIHPMADGHIRIPVTNAAMLILDQPESGTNAALDHVRFVNGDELMGYVTGLDTQALRIATSVAGALSIPRMLIESVEFRTGSEREIYNGPRGTDGWYMTGTQFNQPWVYHDGALTTYVSSYLGRNAHLPDRCLIQFEADTPSRLSMRFMFFTDSIEGQQGRGYFLLITPTGILMGVNTGTQRDEEELRPAGTIPPAESEHALFQIYADRLRPEYTLYLNGRKAGTWTSSQNFHGVGRGIFFEPMNSVPLTLRRIRVAEWNGILPENRLAAATMSDRDVLHFNNGDIVTATARELRDQTVHFATSSSELSAPLARLDRLVFGHLDLPATALPPRAARVFLSEGGSVTLSLERYEKGVLYGSNATLGPVALRASGIRRVYFNITADARQEPY